MSFLRSPIISPLCVDLCVRVGFALLKTSLGEEIGVLNEYWLANDAVPFKTLKWERALFEKKRKKCKSAVLGLRFPICVCSFPAGLRYVRIQRRPEFKKKLLFFVNRGFGVSQTIKVRVAPLLRTVSETTLLKDSASSKEI